MGLNDPIEKTSKWSHGAVALARNETHDKVVEMMEKEPRGKALDVPTGTGVLAGRLKGMGFEISCCDINATYFSIPDLSIDLGDLNHTLPYPDSAFDYVICLDGIEHTENPYNTIREFRRTLRKGGKLYLSIPNFLNIERRVRYLFTGGLSKIPSHETIQKVWNNDLSMAHLSPLGYPLLKFALEHYGIRVLRLEKDRSKPRMILLSPLAWVLRLCGRVASKKRWKDYRLDETLSEEILMGGNTLIIVGEKVAEAVKTIPCEVCGSNDHRFLFEGGDRVFGVPGKFNLVECNECGLIFINPQPDPETLKAYYPDVYYESNPSHYREYSWLRRKVLEAYFGYEPSPRSPQALLLWKKVSLLPFRMRYRHAIPFVEGGRILDIGCGNGTELYKLKAMGWEAYGVEMDAQASERARAKGMRVYTGDLFGAAFPDHFFHVVRMSFVLEHLPNPRETLQEIRRILLPGGRIYISIQNAGSLHYQLFGPRWFSLDVPRHLFSFSPKTIRKLLSSMDLELKSIWFDSGTRSFLASIQHIINDRYQRGAGYTASQAVVKSRIFRTLSCPICWAADRMGWGDLMHLEVVRT